MRETEVLFLEEVRPLQALAAGCGTAGAARQALCWTGQELGWCRAGLAEHTSTAFGASRV